VPYTAEISRGNPSVLLFLIDQSGSMGDQLAGEAPDKDKAQGVADAINRLLQNLVIKCTKDDGVRDYYHVGVLGYGGTVASAFAGHLGAADLVPISQVADSPVRIEDRLRKESDGAGGVVERQVRFPIWFDPVANGGTPMCEALARARSVLSMWVGSHQSCFPPIVVNITDGEATDGVPLSAAQELAGLASVDGNVLLFNLHLSSQPSPKVEFPDSDAGLPDDFARLLFAMSSVLPKHMGEAARQEGYPVTEATRGFAFNADLVSLVKFIDIGTRPSNLR